MFGQSSCQHLHIVNYSIDIYCVKKNISNNSLTKLCVCATVTTMFHVEPLKGGHMKITDFKNKIAAKEGKKVPVNIAQIGEICKVINDLTGGMLYKAIKQLQ